MNEWLFLCFSYTVVKAMNKALKEEGQTKAVSDNGKKV